MLPRPRALVSAFTFLAALVSPALAQSSSPAPVARAYVSTPLAVQGFAVAANGRLTPLPGSPYPGIALTHMSTAKGYLFGSGADANTVYSFAIQSDGFPFRSGAGALGGDHAVPFDVPGGAERAGYLV